MFLVITSNLFNFHAFLPDSRSKGCTCIIPASGTQRQPAVAVWGRVLPAQAPGTTGVTHAWCLILRCHWHPRNLLPRELHRFTNLFCHITGVGNWILQPILQPLSPQQHWKQSLEIASGAILLPCSSFTRVLLQGSFQYSFATFSLKKGWLQMPCLLGIISGLWQPSGRKGKIPDWISSSVF